MSHSFFSPSSAHRWINCPGSAAYPENQAPGGSSSFADDGTASHEFAAKLLLSGGDADRFIGLARTVNGNVYTLDEERAFHIQTYLDDVRRRALGGHLLVEQHVQIPAFGKDQGGTADAVILQPKDRLLVVEDLKYGVGERVYAERNEQGMSYVLGALADAEMIGEFDRFMFVVCQPRLNHIDEWEFSLEELRRFEQRARKAVKLVEGALSTKPGSDAHVMYMAAGDKTCRWCRAKARCPKLAEEVQKATRSDFEDLSAPPPAVPTGTEQLERAWAALPLVKQWTKAVEAEVWRAVAAGEKVNGPDGKPMKIVEGDDGKRVWKDTKEAEETLMLHLPPEKLYAPREIITAPAAAKLLDKKATKALWAQLAEMLVTRKKGQPKLVNGSDSRPPFTGAASSDDFEDELGVE